MPCHWNRAPLGALALALAASSAIGCGSHPSSESGEAEAVTLSQGSWQTIGFGIGGTSVGSGNNILVAYGGYTARDQDSRAWALALNGSASFASLNVGSIYAARGPKDSGYAAREIGNSKLVLQLATPAANADFIIVVAHSSGAFVADELFTEASTNVLAKIVYFDLDGGSWALSSALIAQMKAVYFVDAKDAQAGESHNASAIQSLHAEFPDSHIFQVDADGSGCDMGATWCLHDTLITSRPHDPSTFNLALDYEQFDGRHVVSSYVDQAVMDQILITSSPPSDDASSPSLPDSAPDAALAQTPCATDGDCNQGSDGSGQMCVMNVCEAGCNADWECPGSTTCVSGRCM